MTNILLESYKINAPWLYNELRNYIKPDYTVAVIAFSFRDAETKCLSDWNKLYSKENGKYYNEIIGGFSTYGISENNITFINYFSDTREIAAQKIQNADIVYFPGGLPHRMMDRINEFDLYDTLLNHKGIIMGYSAGAVIQLAEYHLSPDEDYKEFSFFKGIPYLNDFYLEVHYLNTETQNTAIQKVIKERGKIVYATSYEKGAIIVHNGIIKLLGEVRSFYSENKHNL